MISYQKLTAFFGWSSVINIAILCVTFFLLVAIRGVVLPIHSNIFGINAEDLAQIYFQWIGDYKTLIIIFNLVPYVSLKIIGSQAS